MNKMASGGQIQSPDDNRVHMFRLQILIIDGGLLVFRNIVDKTLAVKSMTLSACLNNKRSKSKFDKLKKNGTIKQFQYNKLFPSDKNPATTDMDITLLICLLIELDLFNKKSIEQSQLQSIDAADLKRLCDYRDKLTHPASTYEIQEKEFKNMWTDIEQILVRHSTPDLNIQKIIAGYKTCPLDHEREKILQKEIEKWRKFDEDKYQIRKAELKNGLMTFYKTRHSHVFLSPLFIQKDTPLLPFYIRPELNSIVSTPSNHDQRLPIKLSEMFKTENKQSREIYVVADAGLGKTAFSKYLANLWCQAHCPDGDLNAHLLKDDKDCMQEFDFIFLVLLRDAGNVCSIDELIFEKIVSELGVEEPLSKDDLLKILKNEKSLVILDGLDEWTHPRLDECTHPEKVCNRMPKSIPHRNDREKCTILTTTRPWKLGGLELNSRELGQKVELTKLNTGTSYTLTGRILQRLKYHQNKDALQNDPNKDALQNDPNKDALQNDSNKDALQNDPNKDALHNDVEKFIKEIHSGEIEELTSVPLLLIYAVCLWCDGVQIGSSKCHLYIKIVQLLLSRTIKIPGVKEIHLASASNILECFTKYKICKKYYPLLMTLGKLAYYTLFNETRENTLVFDGSIARKYLTEDKMKFTLATGMLSESKSNTLTEEFIKVSFSHKTVQEFFAAIFISSQSDAQKTVLEKCRNIQDLLDMSNICKFISGLDADRMCSISNDLMSVINGYKETRDYRTRTGDEDIYFNPLHYIQKLFMSCLQEMPESENIQLCLQDFFIDQNTVHSEQLQRLLKQNKTNIKSLYIDTDLTSSSLREIIDLFSLTNLSHIQKLYYDCGWKKAEIHQIFFPSLQAVTLSHCFWTTDEENLSKKMAQLQNLQYLYIIGCSLTHEIHETFLNFISSQKSMKELKLWGIYCTQHNYLHRQDCKRWNLDLSLHSSLSKLYLQQLPCRLQLNITTPSLLDVTKINLDESSLLLPRDMFNIERVELLDMEMSAGSLQNFISVMENLPQSVTVIMDHIQPKTEYDHVRENIRKRSQSFHVIQEESRWQPFGFKTIKPSKE